MTAAVPTKAVVEELGWPTHFRVQVAKGALVLWPGQTLAGPDLAVERIAREQRARRRQGARDDGLSGTERPER